ncbi:hypothetical protein J2X61_002127 [Bacillus sp. 3255]|nr:hypothetical protein [Bacillus sp. 3255]
MELVLAVFLSLRDGLTHRLQIMVPLLGSIKMFYLSDKKRKNKKTSLHHKEDR